MVLPGQRDRDRGVRADGAAKAEASKLTDGAEVRILAVNQPEDDPRELHDRGEDGERVEMTLEIEEIGREGRAEGVRGSRGFEVEVTGVTFGIEGHGGGNLGRGAAGNKAVAGQGGRGRHQNVSSRSTVAVVPVVPCNVASNFPCGR
jgi:hypothetical protein